LADHWLFDLHVASMWRSGLSFREVSVIEVREVLRAWMSGLGQRSAARQAGVDRKTAGRYIKAAQEVGLARGGGVGQLNDAVIGEIVGLVRPVRPDGHGQAWQTLLGYREQITTWVGKELTVVKIHDFLGRRVWSFLTGRWCVSASSAAGSLAAGPRRRCAFSTASPARSVSSTSVGWVCCMTQRRGAVGWCMR
jgi:hypothetical protein